VRGIWVDTDFGFDDLWAFLLLRHLDCEVAGVSLVAGNAPLPQVAANAVAAKAEYGFSWPVWQGADRPLVREPETAERILGPSGMRSRGQCLEHSGRALPPGGGVEALRDWLLSDPDDAPEILALGPLTNIALLLQMLPDLPERVSRIVWMGGSAGAGNHTPKAEFNAVADAEALALVAASGVRLDIVDLTFCRSVTFGPDDLPDCDPLTGDLLGGYLDIGLERGRAGMAIYDPVAAIAVAQPNSIKFQPCLVVVQTGDNASYGATEVTPVAASPIQISVGGSGDLSHICLRALEKEAVHGSRL
jgi:inosine-uridine nucleoside N-ribohydrolase